MIKLFCNYGSKRDKNHYPTTTDDSGNAFKLKHCLHRTHLPKCNIKPLAPDLYCLRFWTRTANSSRPHQAGAAPTNQNDQKNTTKISNYHNHHPQERNFNTTHLPKLTPPINHTNSVSSTESTTTLTTATS